MPLKILDVFLLVCLLSETQFHHVFLAGLELIMLTRLVANSDLLASAILPSACVKNIHCHTQGNLLFQLFVSRT